ncbi:hypothetical protein [uncultured Spirosoma sp.]|uniref:hypothetical protein n=1 Tax=uncultured Spirosoma sp. TaxID=278208 RepID=UPI00258E835E|nr:hypothetical protein [uncultured Spirosoma sp.]
MIRFYAFSSLLMLWALATQAQYQLRPATVTDSHQQTSTGSLRFYDSERSRATIEFIPQGSAVVKTIPVSDVQLLRIDNGSTYRGLTLVVPYYKIEPVLPSDAIIDHTDTTSVLAEQLLDSPLAQLYRFADSRLKTRYVLVKNDSVILLHNIELQLNRQNALYSYSEPVFRRELKAALTECPTLNTDRVQYTENSLIALLSEYLRFCRVTPTQQIVKKAFDSPIVDIGMSGYFLGRVDNFSVSSYMATVQLLLPKRFHNVFVMLDVGRVRYEWEPYSYSNPMLGLFAGRYFGRGAFQAKVYSGITNATGFLDTGVGLSYRKLISVEGRYPVVSLAINGFRTPMSPFLTARVFVPLSKGHRVQLRR